MALTTHPLPDQCRTAFGNRIHGGPASCSTAATASPTGTGFILTQIGLPHDERDPELSTIVFEYTMAAIMNDSKRKSVATADVSSRAVALREALRDKEGLPLTDAERGLLAEWLNQLADPFGPLVGTRRLPVPARGAQARS